MSNFKDVVVVSGVRLPVGSFGGSLKTVSAIDMGAMVVKEAVKRAGIEPAQVDEVIVGQVGQIAECGFVARAISLAAGMPKEAAASTGIREVEKVKLNIQLKNPRDIGSGTGKLELPKLPKLPSFDMRQILAGVAVLVVLAGGYVGIPKVIEYFHNRPAAVTSVEKKEAPAAKPAVAWDKVQVQMEATDNCWLEVKADGKEIFAGMMKAKDKRTFEAKEKLIVKYGNIGVMKLVFNGEPVDLQGQHGVQVKTYTLNGNQDEVKPIPPVKAEVKNTKPAPVKAERVETVNAKPSVAKAETTNPKPAAAKAETVNPKSAETKQ